MKSWLLGGLMAAMAFNLTLTTTDAEAKRFGGGKSFGMQRAAPAKPAPNNPPATAPNANPGAAAAPTAGAAAATATPKRSWMGPVAGLAAGLGIAALFSHLGMGEELANFVMLALLAVVAIIAIRWAMRRFAGGAAQGPALAMAGQTGSAASVRGFQPQADAPTATRFNGLNIGSALPGSTGAGALSSDGGAAPKLPADFDTEGFERIAKMIFIRMQAANDSADLNDLRNFTTPEVFASLRLDLQERGPNAQQTDVERVDAQVLDFAQEADRQIVSVRYQGVLREEAGGAAVEFDEIWHLVKAHDGSPAWAIAGIQQRQ